MQHRIGRCGALYAPQLLVPEKAGDNEYSSMERQFPFFKEYNDITTYDEIWRSDSEDHGSSRSRSHSLSDIGINEDEEVDSVRDIPNHNHILEAEDYFSAPEEKSTTDKRPVTMSVLY